MYFLNILVRAAFPNTWSLADCEAVLTNELISWKFVMPLSWLVLSIWERSGLKCCSWLYDTYWGRWITSWEICYHHAWWLTMTWLCWFRQMKSDINHHTPCLKYVYLLDIEILSPYVDNQKLNIRLPLLGIDWDSTRFNSCIESHHKCKVFCWMALLIVEASLPYQTIV